MTAGVQAEQGEGPVPGDRQPAGARPQDDLFTHVNGAWLDSVEIPADRAVYGSFQELADTAERNVRAIVEDAAAGDAAPGTPLRKVGDLYASFMDEARVEALGVRPIAQRLGEVTAVTDRVELVQLLGALQREGVRGAFGFWVDTDAKNSDRYLAYLSQGGIGLPDESYYREESFAPIRTAYVGHVTRMLDLAGLPDPAGAATRIMALETRIADAHWDRVTNRDATKTYNLVDADGLAALGPDYDWAAWKAALGAAPGTVTELVVRQPSVVTAISRTLADVPLADWKDWLAWQVVHSSAPLLSAALVNENFDFYGRTLTGAPQLRERWKRGVSLVEGALGEAVGEQYVARHFPPQAKARMNELVADLVEAYRRSISGLDWMGPDTVARALAKLERFTPKIGYPDTWRDYSALEIDREDLLANVQRASAFEVDRELRKLGSPVDRSEWFMTPQTVNAYYNPGMNEIVFPAAILQPPFFDADADTATNYGAIGAVIGHEIGHGFDDQGSKYDGDGNLVDWWTDADRAEFDQRTAALIAQYDILEPRLAPGHHVNGALTVGENIGDLGGLAIAHLAYRIARERAGTGDGEGDRRFFLSWARIWRATAREAELLRRLAVDPHSPPEFRCNAVVRNLDAFAEAFDLTPDDALWLDPGQRVRIW